MQKSIYKPNVDARKLVHTRAFLSF